MPNWCYNNLQISGNDKKLAQFISDVAGVEEGKLIPFDFDKILPTPKELLNEVKGFGAGETDPQSDRGQELIKKYGATNWYDWRIANWGVKWNLGSDTDAWTHDQREFAYINFDTAWAPPFELIARASEKYPGIEFKLMYCEPGMCFCGEAIYENGQGSTFDYDWESEDGMRIRDELGYGKENEYIEN